ncbi:MAG: shikimate dehydrogenase [Chloroflexota bacterium]
MTQRVGVIGWPIEHSLSPAMHNAAFAVLGLEWQYDKMAIPPDIVKLSLREFRDAGFVGLNVTVPHKQAVMPFVKPDEIAKAVGAVNTIDFRKNTGTNTDVAGFMGDLTAHGIDPAGMRVVVLGAGGAARAAVYGLAQVIARIVIVNRTPERARELIDSLRVRAITGGVADVADADLIVNCTSVGLSPQVDDSPLPDDTPLKPGVIAYDMIYRPAQTRLMRQVEAAGGRAVGGLGMLVRQGAVAFKIWTGVEPPLDVMFAAAEQQLQAD